MILPPKRFQSFESPIYDPIRHKPWFHRLEVRRKQIPLLREACRLWTEEGYSQKTAAMATSVDERELRDYEKFISGVSSAATKPKSLQAVLDDAYLIYCEALGLMSFRSAINRIAPLYGVNPRHVIEQWEIDPGFWPRGYKQRT